MVHIIIFQYIDSSIFKHIKSKCSGQDCGYHYLYISFVSLFWFFLRNAIHAFVGSPSVVYFKILFNFDFILLPFPLFILYVSCSVFYKACSPFLLLPVSSSFLWWFYFFLLLLSWVLPVLLSTCCVFLELLNFYIVFFIHRDSSFAELCFVFLTACQCIWSLFYLLSDNVFSGCIFYNRFCWSPPHFSHGISISIPFLFSLMVFVF